MKVSNVAAMLTGAFALAAAGAAVATPTTFNLNSLDITATGTQSATYYPGEYNLYKADGIALSADSLGANGSATFTVTYKLDANATEWSGPGDQWSMFLLGSDSNAGNSYQSYGINGQDNTNGTGFTVMNDTATADGNFHYYGAPGTPAPFGSGYVKDSADGQSAVPGSCTRLTATLYGNNTMRVESESLDSSCGNVLQANTAAFVLTTSPDVMFTPALYFGIGADAGGRTWNLQTFDATLTAPKGSVAVPEPSALGLFGFGLLGLGMAAYKRRAKG